MDIQVLNEIANPVRQTALSQVGAPVSANAQLRALKGSPVLAPENPAPPPFDDSPEQTQDPVTPEISSVARAASAYSAAVGDGLNPDELNAIQDLAVRVRTAVSDFLSQPGLEQAENAAIVVASNPEAVQDLTSSVEQAVVETLNLPVIEDEVIVNVAPPNEDLLEGVPTSENLISVERITNGAEPNNPVIAASPALQNAQAREHTNVDNPVTVDELSATSSRDFRVTAAGPALQSGQADEQVRVEAPAIAASPALQSEQVRVETPVVRPEAVVPAQQESASRPEAIATNPQETPVPAATPAAPNAQSDAQVRVETPVVRPEAVVPAQQESVSRPETVATDPQETPVTATSSGLLNVQVQNAEAGNPVHTPVPSVAQGQGLEGAQTVNPEGAVALPEGSNSQPTSGQSNPQPASNPQPGPAPSSDLFAQENAAVNPENIRDVNELVNSIVDNEFSSEAKKIFSEPKVIRTVADLADFILERLREIIAAKRQQSQSNGEIGIS